MQQLKGIIYMHPSRQTAWKKLITIYKKWDIKLKVRQIWNNLIIKWLTQKNSYPSPRELVFESGFWLPTTKPRRWEHITNNNNCENFLFTHQPWLMFNREIKFLLRVKKQRAETLLTADDHPSFFSIPDPIWEKTWRLYFLEPFVVVLG